MLVARILVARGLKSIDSIYEFMRKNLRGLHDPFLFEDMRKAVLRLEKTMDRGGKILIHGDYDADGITSTALMIRALNSTIGPDRLMHHLPSRYGDGYGVSVETVDEAASSDVDLMITVDCGIKALEAADRARDSGIDLIITDHHEPGDELPKATALIDPKLEDSKYPFKDLAGVGVAFKLVHALELDGKLNIDSRDLLDLVAFGTVADLVPLIDENRTLVSVGLERMKETGNLGLRSLMMESGIDTVKGPSATDIAFKMGPRVNSAGRMGDPEMALELFLTDDRVDADLFSRQLNHLNFKRRAVGNKLVETILREIDELGIGDDPFIIVAGKDWNPGVLGISANKIMIELARPVAVLSIDEKGRAKGSARAPSGFDLINCLKDFSDLLLEWGGHERAAGLTLFAEKLPELRKKLVKRTTELYPGMDFIPSVDIDIDLAPAELTETEVQGLDLLRPFGTGNSHPIVSIRDVMIGGGLRTVGDGKHLKFTLEEESLKIGCIYFDNGHLAPYLGPGSIVSIAGEPSIHRWGGRSDVQIRVIDLVNEDESL
jgi:single-stranded-DNA-specific exonuclease